MSLCFNITFLDIMTNRPKMLFLVSVMRFLLLRNLLSEVKSVLSGSSVLVLW